MRAVFYRHALILSLGAALGAASYAAKPAKPGPASHAQAQERAACDNAQQDRTACLREAAAARQAERQGALTSAADYRANALARCSRQPQNERAACEARVLGTGQTRVDGSVMGGGLLRETVTPAQAPR